jgi:hypothetical protein
MEIDIVAEEWLMKIESQVKKLNSKVDNKT